MSDKKQDAFGRAQEAGFQGHDYSGETNANRRRRLEREDRVRWNRYFQAHPQVLDLLSLSTLIRTAPTGGGAAPVTDHPLKVKDATASGTVQVVVVPGTASYVVPTIGGTPITAGTPPTLTITASGFVVMKTTWESDFLPRSVPLTVEFVFEAGDPDAPYTPAFPDTTTAASLAHARVWVAGGAITNILTSPSGNIVLGRSVYDDGTVSFFAARI